jgi:hypothetical protein
MSKDNYTINIDFSASYGKDKENAGVTCSVRDSEGLNVSKHKKIDGDDIDTALAEIFDDVICNIVASKTTKPKTKEEELQAKLDSVAIDNKVLQARLGKLQEAYDTLVKSNQNKCTCECRTKPSTDKKINDPCVKVTNAGPKYYSFDNRNNVKRATTDDLESYVNELYKDIFNRFIK